MPKWPLFFSSINRQIKKLRKKEELKRRELERQIITEAQKEGDHTIELLLKFDVIGILQTKFKFLFVRLTT